MKIRSITIAILTAFYLMGCTTTPTDTTIKKTITSQPSALAIEETQIQPTHSNPQQITTPTEPTKNIKVEHVSLLDKINFSCIADFVIFKECEFKNGNKIGRE